MVSEPAIPAALPEGFEPVRDLATGAGAARVTLARRFGETFVVRVEPATGSGQASAELRALAGLAHPGLARLVDHGALPDGSVWLARRWIEGQDLAAWWQAVRAEDGAPARLGRLVVELCAALEHLHARGVVHADLKPGNVLVTDEGRPVLTDFGLSRARGAVVAAAGTPFFVAPEVLQGADYAPAVDLFAVGATLVRLLVPRRLRAAELYARFPRTPFLEALGVRPEELPDWARDIVSALVAADPSRRPRSAAHLGRVLAGRLGVPWSGAAAVDLSFTPLEGRGTWCRAELEHLRERRPAGGVAWWRLPRDEDPSAFVAAARTWFAVQGLPTASIAPSAVDGLEPGSAAFDAAARTIAARASGSIVFHASGDGARETQRAAHLARAVARDGGLLVVAAAAPSPLEDAAERAVPPVDEAHVGLFLERELDEPDAPRRAALARALHAGGGASTGVAERLERAVASGWILAGDTRPRLRPGAPPSAQDLAPGGASIGAVRADVLALVAALAVLGGRATSAEVSALAEVRAAPLLADLAPWVRAGAGGDWLLTVAADAIACPPETWRELHARRAAGLRAGGAARAAWLPHAWRAELPDGGTDAVVEESRALRAAGAPGLALDLAERIFALARAAGRDPGLELSAEEAFGWLALGEPERARAVVESRLAGAAASARGWRARVLSALAAAERDQERALALAHEARALDARHAEAALDVEARALFEAGRDAELEALERNSRDDAAVGERARANLSNLLAASLQRRGETARARALFEELLAGADEESPRTASICQNLGTLERRSGDLARARDLFERAARIHERSGTLAGLAHARTQIGGILREEGRLLEAAAPLEAAVDACERMGDAAGAALARGTCGLLLAERGHLHAAGVELARAAADLEARGRRAHAAYLHARGEEVRARLGQPAGPAERERARSDAGGLDADPRALVALARAAWLRGAFAVARERAERAAELARSLELIPVAQEADALLHGLRRAPRSDGGPAPRDAVIEALAEPFDSARARALAEELESRGSDDRAARLWIALAARCTEPDAAREAGARARELWKRCTAGLGDGERDALRRALLARPDPQPADLAALDAPTPEEQEHEMEIVRLLEINQKLVEEQDLTKLLGAIVEHALAVSGAERGFLVLEEDGELVFDSARDSRRGDIEAPELEVSRSVVQEALESGEPLRLSNATEDPELGGAPSVSALDLRSILCVPFTIDARSRGVIYVDHRVRVDAFGERAERLLALLAGQAALAIRQVRRLEEIRRLNSDLEQDVAHKESDLRVARVALREAGVPAVPGGLVGRSAAMRRVHGLVERAAEVALPVLVVGASGTGKELVARALHAQSPRVKGPFVAENCAALPASLVEAELFGARRGAFTGADTDRPGLFERAHGGTLFLDEIGELPIELQAKLLRVLETGEVRRLGEGRVRKVDFRLLAATNRDLEAQVRAGTFRADLFYRLDGLRIALPPLSERVEDIPLLVEHFLRLEGAESGTTRAIAPAVLSALSRRAWPGNVRELRNEVARLCVLCPGDLDDPAAVRPARDLATEGEGGGAPRTLAEIERTAIERAIRAAGGDKTQAAAALGISRAKVYQRVKEWRLEETGSDATASS